MGQISSPNENLQLHSHQLSEYMHSIQDYGWQDLGIIPGYSLAFFDWLVHWAGSPAKQIQVHYHSYIKMMELQQYLLESLNPNFKSDLATKFDDPRFKQESWQQWPYNLFKAGFLVAEQLSKNLFIDVPGSNKHYAQINQFLLQQWFNFISPHNGIFTNPEIIKAIQDSNGQNLRNGISNLLEDCYRNYMKLPAVGLENFVVGKNLAITPGKVIYRNKLIELIQYTATTKEVHAEPILIVPACIMKYYILDLSAHNSLVKYLVSQGHTVFIISWKNPQKEDQDLSFDDYINLGVLNAIEVINSIMPGVLIHAAGYCLGGTMLSCAAAYLAGKSITTLKTVTLLAAQVDFTAAGELQLFIDPSQIFGMKQVMRKNGYLDGKQMAAAFNLLHSNELVWGKMVQDYLLGERKPLFDIMAWNQDTTRLPCKMHSEYLEKLFYGNALVNGEFSINQQAISLANLHMPIFAVGTATDHVAPWKSVYKINFFAPSEVTFVLTTGGHNAGIVSEAGNTKRSYQILSGKPNNLCISQDLWQQTAPTKQGSWWLAWQQWLASYSSGMISAPNQCGNKEYTGLGDAPGIYVLEK